MRDASAGGDLTVAGWCDDDGEEAWGLVVSTEPPTPRIGEGGLDAVKLGVCAAPTPGVEVFIRGQGVRGLGGGPVAVGRRGTHADEPPPNIPQSLQPLGNWTGFQNEWRDCPTPPHPSLIIWSSGLGAVHVNVRNVSESLRNKTLAKYARSVPPWHRREICFRIVLN